MKGASSFKKEACDFEKKKLLGRLVFLGLVGSWQTNIFLGLTISLTYNGVFFVLGGSAGSSGKWRRHITETNTDYQDRDIASVYRYVGKNQFHILNSIQLM